MSGFLDVNSVQIPRRLVALALAHMQQMGQQQSEGLALWAGVRETTSFHVRHTIIPVQHAVRSGQGVCVIVGPEELHRINVWLFQNKLSIIAQLHSHPTEAYHSDTDEALPIATTVGCLSVVVPDFARGPFALDRCAVYRLMTDGTWAELPTQDVLALIQITD